VLILADSSYPLADVFWTMVIFFVGVMWIWLLISIFADLFGRHDLSGGTKALWTFALLILPFFGVFMYVVSQGSSMAERRGQSVRAQQSSPSYVTPNGSANGSANGGTAAEIGKAKELLDTGAINADEYEVLKGKALAG
jgi:hypothetical protein